MNKYTMEEIEKSIGVAKRVYESIEALLNSMINQKSILSKDKIEEILIDIHANIYAHWTDKQMLLNVYMVINDFRYNSYKEKIQLLTNKDLFNFNINQKILWVNITKQAQIYFTNKK